MTGPPEVPDATGPPEEYVIRPVGHVRGARPEPTDDQWGPVTATSRPSRCA